MNQIKNGSENKVSIVLLKIKIFLDLVLFLNLLMKGLEIREQQGLKVSAFEQLSKQFT